MTRHVDAEVLGRFSAGDLSRSRSARVGAHLRSCDRCAELGRQLAGIAALLASVPAPPMPEHLTTRISNSLASEAARRAAREAAASTDQADPGGARRVPERRVPERRVPWPRLGSSPVALRVLAAAGAAAVLAGGGYAIVRTTAGPTSVQGTPAAPASPEFKAPVGDRNGARSAAAAGALAVGPALSYQTSSGPAGFRPVTSGADYAPGQLAAQVSAALARLDRQRHVPNPGISQHAPSATEPGTAQFGGLLASTIEGCVSRIAAGRTVLLVDIARYRGGPATIIVVRGPAPAADHVWVAGPACSGTASDVLAQAELPR